MKSLLFLLSILLIGLASATVSIEGTINKTNTNVNMIFDSVDMSFDEQNIVYGQYELEGLLISEFLKGIDFEARLNNGKVEFITFNITTPYTTMLINNALNALDLGFDVDDLNINASLLNDVYDFRLDGNGYVKKIGTSYNVNYDQGFSHSKINYFQEENASYIRELANKYFSFFADFTSINLSDGIYDVPLTFGIDEQKETTIVKLTIENTEEATTYVPEDEIIEVIPEIKGLEIGTTIVIEEKNITDFVTPTEIIQLKVLNISTSQNTSGEIYFNINKSLVINKDKISLYVLEGVIWTKLNTTYLNETATEYEYKAYTPHFSIFTIAEEKVIPPTDTGSSSGSGGGSSRRRTPVKVEPVIEEEIEEIPLEMDIGTEEEIKPLILKPEEKKDYKWIWFVSSLVIIVIAIVIVIKIRGKNEIN
jgi:hypothetical protein